MVLKCWLITGELIVINVILKIILRLGQDVILFIVIVSLIEILLEILVVMRLLGLELLMIIIKIVEIGLEVLGLGSLIIGTLYLTRWVSIMLMSISMEGDYFIIIFYVYLFIYLFIINYILYIILYLSYSYYLLVIIY